VGLKLRLHPRAVRDLQDIHDYRVREHGAQAAERVRAELNGSIQRLARHPFRICRETGEADVRVLSVTRYPYLIYYTVTAVACTSVTAPASTRT
jgi:plasmid stabilization system protein ParE